MQIELEVHAQIGNRIQVDRWLTDDDYSTCRGEDGHSCVVTLENGMDEQGNEVKAVSYGKCWRIVIRPVEE